MPKHNNTLNVWKHRNVTQPMYGVNRNAKCICVRFRNKWVKIMR